MTKNEALRHKQPQDSYPIARYSGNLYKYLPNNKIKPGIRITSGGDFNARYWKI
jgi:hypothetical protein